MADVSNSSFPDKTPPLQPAAVAWKDRLEIAAKIAGILTPIVLFIFTQQVNNAQNKHNAAVQQTAEQQQDLNRVATLIKSLSSSDSIERKYAVTFAGVLVDQRRFPVEMFTALGLAAKTDPSLRDKVSTILDTLRSQSVGDTAAARQVTKALAYVPRIYPEYPRGSYPADSIKAYVNRLSEMGYNVEPPEALNMQIDQTQLRYYYKAEEGTVKKLMAELAAAGVPASPAYIKGYESNGKVKPYTYELWLAGSPSAGSTH